MRKQTGRVSGLAALALLGALGGISTAGDSGDETGVFTSAGESGVSRLREGAILTDQPGTFQLVGKRMVFAFDGEARQLGTLENLALDRVVRLVREAAVPQTWLVSGTVTEYQGNNFLLIDRAVIRRAGDVQATNP